MTASVAPVGSGSPPDRLFPLKARLLAVKRIVQNLLSSDKPVAWRRDNVTIGETLARDVSPLYTARDPREFALELGKVQNLRVAAKRLDGLVFDTGELFSFWHVIGRPTRSRGFVEGRELRQGCLIPTIAGGICQMTNALSCVVEQAGMEIVERHRHSATVDGLALDPKTDATVFWNYVDFRFRAARPIRLTTRLTRDNLEVVIDALA
ncbi:VanW family protein [Alterisphingorhabdus coralli]|uniref:VanW family protein n=1 Tax=Alterisphingorhabdus coralli TaxID=3071408 RepID=A0AA97F4Y4_9SPHN|nr:VanW family protein [Parasphingorhabdus sp. SCSIO 66989]WOE74101.1 VanW family protein [Parasphingorhabdus sp. SCSIO 66989]